MAEKEWKFKKGDRVMTKEGVGTVVEIREFWMRAGVHPEPSKTPYRVLRDDWLHAPALYSEEALTPATPEEAAVRTAGPWRDDRCPRCGETDLKKLVIDDPFGDTVRCMTCAFAYEPSPRHAPRKKSKASAGK